MTETQFLNSLLPPPPFVPFLPVLRRRDLRIGSKVTLVDTESG